MRTSLPALLERAARLAGQRLPPDRGEEVGRIIEAEGEGLQAPELFAEGWRAGGLAGDPLPIAAPEAAHLPFAAWRPDLGWLLVLARGADGNWRAEAGDGSPLSLAGLEGAACVSLPRRKTSESLTPRAAKLVWNAVMARKSVFLEAVLATGLVNLITLATSLFSMQVYDRVIPNHGFQTLWVLSVGVGVAIALEFMLKEARSRTVDRACTAIDHGLSEWFFGRTLSIRMEKRPPSVGTLASQVKGFELVRGVLTSTSLFVLADVPFAIFFIIIIGLVGGWTVLVPLVALPVALVAGLVFQGAIQRHTRLNLSGSNKKAGLLVEAIDGAESLKANGAEWKLQGRWNQLVAEVSESEQKIRSYSALSQNVTMAMQQLGYVALVALGAYFVTENQLSMGGLLACSIVSNRAMSPIIQLPAVMVQWAHARAAIEGLDRIIALPSESEDEQHALTPASLEGSLRFDRTHFSYGTANRLALEIETLAIAPGDRVGILGSIGSGKSTLLKLASGLFRPTEGKVFLGGVDMALLSPPLVRETVGYLPQDVRLFSGTLRDNLLLGLADPGDEPILAAARRTGLMELIAGQPKGLGLEITEGGRGVSGGQKQLIALTRMLLAKPRIWLLDEPTGSMDAMTEARITALLGEVISEGATLLVSTHKTALLPLMTHLVVLQEGRLLMAGARDQVLAKLSGRPQAQQGVGT
ncbi:MAG: ATP-binding cassette domain-containing protein [Rhodocyclaceae bacterium]|nr:ATP-binding cassette domain-containing protein [Rhodocyclaceae bacterium]